MLMRVTRVATLAVTLVLPVLGCTESSAPEGLTVSLAVVAPTTVQGAEICYTLENRTNGPVGYSPCEGAFVFRLVGSQWTAVERTPTVCSFVYEPLAPGARRQDVWIPREQLVPGQYRLQVGVVELRGTRRGPVISLQAPAFTLE